MANNDEIKFYDKSYLASVLNGTPKPKSLNVPSDKPKLRLHESFATICSRASSNGPASKGASDVELKGLSSKGGSSSRGGSNVKPKSSTSKGGRDVKPKGSSSKGGRDVEPKGSTSKGVPASKGTDVETKGSASKEGTEVKGEVVACHIFMLPSSAKLFLCKNTDWTNEDREYVKKVLKCLTDMGNYSQTNEINKGPEFSKLLRHLRDLIYKYCQARIEFRIWKLFFALTGANKSYKIILNDIKLRKEGASWTKLDNKFWNAENTYPQLEQVWTGLGDKITKTKRLMGAIQDVETGTVVWQKLAGISHCWGTFLKQLGDQKNGVLERALPQNAHKRMRKVASYSASINNIVAWAVKSDSYKQYSKIYPELSVRYSKIIEKPVPPSLPQEVWLDRLQNYFDQATYKKLIVQLTKRGKIHDTPPPHDSFFVHAEMHMAPELAKEGGSQYIGISKFCCYLCNESLRALESSNNTKFIVRGAHNIVYPKWKIPDGMSKEHLQLVEKELNGVIQQALDEKNLPRRLTVESIANTKNTDDFDYQSLIK